MAAVMQVAVAAALVAAALAVSRLRGLGLERELGVAAARATVQLAAVGAVVTLVFAHLGLAVLFVAGMLAAASATSGRRLRGVPRASLRAGAAIGLAALSGLAPLLATGAFSARPREVKPLAGILIGGAMAAASLAGRRLVEDIGDRLTEIEARLALGVGAREALAPVVTRAVGTGMVPVLDQTRTVGIVALPGTFVGLVLGGASPAQAARVQLTVLLCLLGVELVAAVGVCALVARAALRPGERVVPPAR